MSQIYSPNTIKSTTSGLRLTNGENKQSQRCNSCERDEDEESNLQSANAQKSTLTKTTSTNDKIFKEINSMSSNAKTIATTTTSSEFTNNDDGCGNKALAQVMERSQWKINTSLKNKPLDYSQICSICLSDSKVEQLNQQYHLFGKFVRKENLRDKNSLISPCLCADIRSHQHKRCIEEWIEQTGVTSCPFCFVKYDYSRKRKSFWSYVKDCELEHEFFVSLVALSFSIYLFLVGLTVCYHYIIASINSDTENFPAHSNNKQEFMMLNDYTESWYTFILFCFICSTTGLLLIGIVSVSLKLIFRHYVKYWLWSRTHYSVDIKPYSWID